MTIFFRFVYLIAILALVTGCNNDDDETGPIAAEVQRTINNLVTQAETQLITDFRAKIQTTIDNDDVDGFVELIYMEGVDEEFVELAYTLATSIVYEDVIEIRFVEPEGDYIDVLDGYRYTPNAPVLGEVVFIFRPTEQFTFHSAQMIYGMVNSELRFLSAQREAVE